MPQKLELNPNLFTFQQTAALENLRRETQVKKGASELLKHIKTDYGQANGANVPRTLLSYGYQELVDGRFPLEDLSMFERSLNRREPIIYNQIRIATLYNLGFDFSSKYPHPIENHFESFQTKHAQFAYVKSPKKEKLWLVRSVRKRGKEAIIRETLIYAQDEVDLRYYLEGKLPYEHPQS